MPAEQRAAALDAESPGALGAESPGELRATPGAIDGRRARWTEHRRERRVAFVEAGAAAIDHFGPEASAEQIAEFAGVSRTVLYRYFRDREDLRQAIADHVASAVLASVLPNLQISPLSTPRDVIESVIVAIVGWLDEHPNLYYFLRSRRSLETVEHTLADRIGSLLKGFLMFFGLDEDAAEPGAYGIVGLVESTGAWWLTRRSMPRQKLTELLCASVWNLLDGVARANGIVIGYEQPLPLEAVVPAGDHAGNAESA